MSSARLNAPSPTEQYLQALRALRTAHSLDPNSAALHPLLIRFKVLASSLTTLPDAVRTTIEAGLAELLGGLSVDEFNAQVLQRNVGSPEHVVAAARGTLAMRVEATAEAEGLVFQLLREETLARLQVRV